MCLGLVERTQGTGGRGYLSNVCVAPGARRQGIAQCLLEESCRLAPILGVQEIYVHVETCNQPAQALYAASGFEMEAKEDADTASYLDRRPRLLLRKNVCGK
ncbi:hypothetical protein CYMTET_33315 [Cymbomonas tetramitiformis]|uniref:N-acetyltransferase domain-containing protein n=1 Tax=Cymbomonas tetramitiformis TaxID=36881 RepID=A0AAE0FDH1_9CHLO|nr:hypothetical protein CYMTET_33315 [Cymbomonas tetramitiformis]